MGYQALLFCPDDKTARAVTQVLGELEFAVVPCTEPFGAVKKLMAEHFDAIVVDCDNEQNATLLFKSARNTPNNQSALAVAVVEGQAGVAKAFRIGANLVLTKPINVEQAKGTLRVARGLLRKNEAAKSTGAINSSAKPTPAPTPKPTTQVAPGTPGLSSADPTGASATKISAPGATAHTSIPPQNSLAWPKAVDPVPIEIADDADILEADDEIVSLPQPASALAPTVTSASTIASAPPAKVEPTITAKTARSTPPAGFGPSAGSAPAPARKTAPEKKSEEGATVAWASTSVVKRKTSIEDGTANDNESTEIAASLQPAFTFGGNVDGETASSGGSKKILVAVAVVVLVAAGGYAAWMQYGHSSEKSVPIARPTQAVKSSASEPATAAIPPAAPNANASNTSSSAGTTSTGPATPTIISDSDAATHPGVAKNSSEAASARSAEASVRPSKISTESSKPSASTPAAKVSETKAAERPIEIKSGASPAVAKAAPALDAPAPTVNGIGSANSGALPNLIGTSKAPTPVLQTVRVSQGVSQALLIKKVPPVYPPNALRLRREGAVELLTTISKTGDISAVKIVKGDPLLAHAAVEAVKQWKYKPYLLDGEPMEVQTPITVNFTLP